MLYLSHRSRQARLPGSIEKDNNNERFLRRNPSGHLRYPGQPPDDCQPLRICDARFRAADLDKHQANETKPRQRDADGAFSFRAIRAGICALFDRDRFCEIARLVHIRPFLHSDMIGQQLDGQRIQDRRDERVAVRQFDTAGWRLARRTYTGRIGDQNDLTAPRRHFL